MAASKKSMKQIVKRLMEKGVSCEEILYDLIAAIDESRGLKEELIEKINQVHRIGVSYEEILSSIAKVIDEKFLKTQETGNELQNRVTEILMDIGMPAHINGYNYVRTAIVMSIENPMVIKSFTKNLYPTVAKEYETTSSRVEKNIRHAIEVTWSRGNPDAMEKYFGYKMSKKRGKPTNSEFIAMIRDKISLEKL